MSNPFAIDPDVLIDQLAGPLAPTDREAFRQAAHDALARVPCWGEGAVYRAIVAVQRGYFHPPDVAHDTGRHADRRARAMRAAELIADDRKRK